MSKKRTLAGFDEVGSTETNNNENVIENDNVNNNVVKYQSFEDRHTKSLLYLENELVELLDKRIEQLVNQGAMKKGLKTKLVNDALREFLK